MAAVHEQISREESLPNISRENSFTEMIGVRRLSALGLTGLQERREVTWMEDVLNYLYPDKSLEDIYNPKFYKDLFVEFICCAYFICLVNWVLVTNHTALYSPNTGQFGLFAGFLVFALVECWAPLHGGLLNPAGVWGFWLAGRMSFARFILASAAEVCGAAAGGMIGYSITPTRTILHAIKPTAGLSDGQGAAVEGFVTFHLILVALSVTNPKKHSKIAGLTIGLCKGSGILAAGTHTGGLANPIVPFGPAVATKDFEHHFVVYWLGAYIGATISALIYVFATKVNEHFDPETMAANNISPEIQLQESKKGGVTFEVGQTSST